MSPSHEEDAEGISEEKKMKKMSIYDSFRALAIFSFCVGYFPVRNLLRGPYLCRHRCFYLFFPAFHLASLSLIYFVWFHIQLLEVDHSTILTFTKLYFAVYILTSCAQYFLAQVNLQGVCQLFRRIDRYDSCFLGQQQNHINCRLRYCTWTILFVLLVHQSLQVVVICHYFSTVENSLVLFVSSVYLDMVSLVPATHVLFLANSVRLRLDHLNHSMETRVIRRLPRNLLLANQPHQQQPGGLEEAEEVVEEALEELSEAYAEMADLVSAISYFFGLSLVTTFLASLLNIIFLISIVIFTEAHSYINVVQVFMAVLLPVGLAVTLQKVPEEATRITSDLCRVRLLSLSSQCRIQVQTLIQRMSGPLVQISAANFFPINRGLITSMSAAVTTYLIVLAQFKGAEYPTDITSYCKFLYNQTDVSLN